MNCLLLILNFLVLIAAPGCALKCYYCAGTEDTCSKSNLEKNRNVYLKECPFLYGLCYRTWEKKIGQATVSNGCTTEYGCASTKSFCDQLKNNDKDYECEVGCCTSDACNTGSPVTFSFSLLIFPPVLGLALMM